MPSMKNLGVSCLIHDVTACFASSSEIPLEVRKEMEIAWRQVRAVGRMGENLKLQRLQEHQSLREQCAVLHCHAATKSAMLTP